jgi:hypothetical protein
MSHNNIPAQVQTLINKAYLAIKEKRPEWYSTITDVHWEMNSRLRRVLGKAKMNYRMNSYTIQLNSVYASTVAEDSLYDTIVHELAHIIAYRIYHDTGHGSYWRTVFLLLGGSGNRCAKPGEGGYMAERNRIKRIILEKGGKEYKITPNRYNRCPEAYTRLGYAYRRTIIINPDNTEIVVHSHKESAIFLDANLNVVAAHSAT